MTSSTASLSSFEDFYGDWYPRAVRAARKRGLPDPEAVASDIMMVFLEKDYLSRYDPTKKGAASFDTWVNSIVYNRLNNAYRNESRRATGHTVELQDHDMRVQDDLTVEFKLMAMSAFELIKDRYGIEIADVFVSVVKQVVEGTTSVTGDVRRWLTAKHLDVKAEIVSERVVTLRELIEKDTELRELLGADRWSQQAA